MLNSLFFMSYGLVRGCLWRRLILWSLHRDEVVKDVAIPFSFHGCFWVLGIQGGCKYQHSGQSQADWLPMMHKRHPQIAVECLRVGSMSDVADASMVARDLNGVMGFEPPSWQRGSGTSRSQFFSSGVGSMRHRLASRDITSVGSRQSRIGTRESTLKHRGAASCGHEYQ